jgi:hypothetical protein
MDQKQLKIIAWGSFSVSAILALTVWGSNYEWTFVNGYLIQG